MTAAEPVRTQHFPQGSKCSDSVLHHLVHDLLVSTAGKLLLLRNLHRKPSLHLQGNPRLLCQSAEGFHKILSVFYAPDRLHGRIFLIPVPDHRSADKISPLRIQIKLVFSPGRQKGADQLPVLLCHLGDLPEPGQDHMVKFSQPVPSHKKTEASVHRNVSQTLQTV